MIYNDYHNLSAYQKARDLTKQIIALSDKLPKNRAFDAIYVQIVRSVSSIGANIVEGYGRNNPREYRQFLGIARGSCFEKEIVRLLTVMIKNLGNSLRAAPVR